jgi:hypothetical protein
VKRNWNVIFFSAFVITSLFSYSVSAEDKWKRIINLEGRWKFSIGDNKKWAAPSYIDKDWESIEVPANWEDEGFYGYNGHAWYRTTFNGADLQDKTWSFNLFLGYIDDVDEVYLNGHKIGTTGSFPPHFQTAYNALRNYIIPSEYLNFQGPNIIAVRVYDSEVAGGIVSGDIGIYSNETDRALTINLRGQWDFALSEKQFGSPRNKSTIVEKLTFPEKPQWSKIAVPSNWENQGYNNYDGSAWYRKQFVIPKKLQGEDLVLLLGKIDDFDQTYLNGKLVGSTNSYDRLRIYHIPSDMINAGAVNLLMIYVDDPQGMGGIHEGPIGIMKQTEFTRYMRWREE